jgi:hypothetical protein
MKLSQSDYAAIAFLIIVMIAVMSSCTTYGKGCTGNSKMLTAGQGYTKFKK